MDETGVNTAKGRYDLDILIFATGFDAGVGAFNNIDVRGLGGAALRDAWAGGVRTTVGMQVNGFPNMFMTMAPSAPASALCNLPVCSDQQVSWISDTIAFVRRTGAHSIEPSAETEDAWMAHHREVSEPTLIGRNPNSWYRLKDEEGRGGELLAYAGGVAHYRSVCDGYAASGYQGFNIR